MRVTYMELLKSPRSIGLSPHPERIINEALDRDSYLSLYRRVGAPVRWDQRLLMPAEALAALLGSGALDIYVLRNERSEALGFCEFDTREFPEIELKNFGLVTEAHGRGLGSWLLSVALQKVWTASTTRIWLHTDTWDHPAAIHVYQRAGFRVYEVRDEAVNSL